ncbi:MAG: glycosyltransferase [Chloroflexi bacterium]|nr:glycosyltransferase [Chloroflexota bacterium]
MNSKRKTGSGWDIEIFSKSRRRYWTLGFSLSVLPLLVRAERVYRDLPQLRSQACTATYPSLSIIVPARNEAQNLRRLLPSLERQDYPGQVEIIVVDDHSTDCTVQVVECRQRYLRAKRNVNCGIKWIPAASPAVGWLGKPNASHTGACAARGEWLLFTDADTEHKAFSAASAIAFAQAHNLDGLSIFPQQETRGIVDGAVLMVAFAGLFAGLRHSTTMLNGQYLLIRREVYEASGGFAAVRAEMMEDLAYGRLLAEQGYYVPIMRGESLVSVYMYDNWRQMWQGVNRLGAGSLRYNGLLALIPAIFVTGIIMPLWTLLFNRRYMREIPSLWLLWFASLVGFFSWASRFNRNQETAKKIRTMVLGAMMAPLAAVFVQLASVWGLVSRLLGWGVSWKDRKV